MTLEIKIDRNEHNLLRKLDEMKVEYSKEVLSVGDIHFEKEGKVIRCYERKTFKDFLGSLIDGRLYEQLGQAKLTFQEEHKIWYILEGSEFLNPEGHTGKMSPNSIHGCLSYFDAIGIHRVHTSNVSATAKLIIDTLSKMNEGKEINTGTIIPNIKKVENPLDIQRKMLCCIPQVSAKRSFDIIDKYGSVIDFMVATRICRKAVIDTLKGIGKKIGYKSAEKIVSCMDPIQEPDLEVKQQIDEIVSKFN